MLSEYYIITLSLIASVHQNTAVDIRVMDNGEYGTAALDGSNPHIAPDGWYSSGSSLSTSTESNCYSQPCLKINAGKCSGCWAYWNPTNDVSLYDSLQLTFQYYHNGLGTDGTRECHFEYSCDGVTPSSVENGVNPDDFAGQNPYLYYEDISDCAGKGTLNMKFYCTGTSSNEANAFIDNFKLSGNLAPTPEPTNKPTARPTNQPTANPSTKAPSQFPTTLSPTDIPSKQPSETPTNDPTVFPTQDPVIAPTEPPTNYPTHFPTAQPSPYPSESPITTIEPTIEPTRIPTEQPTPNPTEPLCKTNLDGNGAWTLLSQFRTWNNDRHSFKTALTTEGYYYMHPCHGVERTDMPFSLIAYHSKMGLDYVALELYDDDDARYVIWFSSSIQEWMELDETITTDTRYTASNETSDLSIDRQSIGKFIVTIDEVEDCTNETTKECEGLSLTVSIGDCELKLSMTSIDYGKGEYLLVAPPDCYRCYSCGLFGDFNTKTGDNSFQACDASTFSFEKISQDEEWDRKDGDGWTWRKSFVDNDCGLESSAADRRRLQTDNDTTISQLCINDETLKQSVSTECKLARDMDLISVCCDDVIGGNFCANLEDICYDDACVIADGNITLIPNTVEQIFTNIVSFTCSLPDIEKYFEEDDLIWSGESDESDKSDLLEWIQNALSLGMLVLVIIGGGFILFICCVCVLCCCCCRKKKAGDQETALSSNINQPTNT